MIAVLFLLLLVIWAAVLIPPWLRNRRGMSPRQSIAGFSRSLSLLGGRNSDRPLPRFGRPMPALTRLPFSLYGSAGGQPPSALLGRPDSALRQSPAQRRRTHIVEALLGTAAFTLVLGVLPPLRFLLVIFLLDLVALAGYAFLLVQWKRNRVEQSEKVRPLAVARGSHEPVGPPVGAVAFAAGGYERRARAGAR